MVNKGLTGGRRGRRRARLASINRPRIAPVSIVAGLFALAALTCVPLGLEAGALLAAADDPAALSDRALDRAFDRTVAAREIAAALAAGDSDLAASYVELAQERGVPLPPEVLQRVAAAVVRDSSAAAAAESFTRGLITGEPDDMAGLAGTVLGDLFVFGDVRDVVREGGRYVSGRPADELVLGLACIGIAFTAGTYVSFGAAAPVRIGISALKAGQKTGRIGAQMAGWIGRTMRDVLDWPSLRHAAGSWAQPAVAVRTMRQVVKLEKADGLVKLAGDVGRVQSRAGAKAAIDGLRLAESPREMTRVAALAEKKGGKTRAILKTLGRGAILLTVGLFNLAMWVLWAALAVFGFVSSAKAAAERLTLRYLARKKARQRGRALAMPAAAMAPARA
jgi:hypothetical protein